LDELEKALPHVVKLFLQVMSDGIMTDATGNKADFKNVIFIMTGNFGSNAKKKSELGFGAHTNVTAVKEEQNKIIKYCRERYGAEFINRVDEFVVFSPLNDAALKTIVNIKLEEVCKRLVDRKCVLRFSNSVADLLVTKSKQSHGGNATVLDRLIAREIEPCVSDALLSLDQNYYVISIGVKKGELTFSKRKSASPTTERKIK